MIGSRIFQAPSGRPKIERWKVMAWPPLDHGTYFWLAKSVAAPALRVTADDLMGIGGSEQLAASLRAAADDLATAATTGDVQHLARTAGRGLVGSTTTLTPWGKQLFRAAVRLLVAAAHGPGDELHAEDDQQAWRWAARTSQRANGRPTDVDRIAVMLVAGMAIDHGPSFGSQPA